MKHALLAALVTTTLLGLNGCAWFGGGSDATAPKDQAGADAAERSSDDAQKVCGADRLKDLTGVTLDQDVRQQIVDQSQAQQFRVLAPETIKTMDYRQDRLNINVNQQGVIQSFDCG